MTYSIFREVLLNLVRKHVLSFPVLVDDINKIFVVA
ncbi:terminase ATPase subunit [Suid betaherpesvirus 2]|uniref:Terminase ATPase subunit n=1 Tax=Suid betaherpesvirus 2 TaxID=1608255 RepID=U3GVA9_9BETA|nr:terminase ATPase subunit [Suid betaherpesvirus 2]AGT99253.1 terminase ATPase subunit [Suid betaherpesvirus 2]